MDALNGKAIYLKEAPFNLEEDGELISRFLSNWDDNHWFIELPYNPLNGKSIYVDKPRVVRVIFYDNQQVKNYFDTVLERVYNKPFVLRLHKVEKNKIMRVQRRKYFRIEDQKQLLLLQFNKHTLSERTETNDISGGGLSFTVKENFDAHIGDKITGFLFLNENRNIIFHSKVIRILLNGNQTKNIAVEFTEIAESERQSIIEHCYNLQNKKKSKNK
ncbi:PilZ domain-containing protein [Aneurinibacillus sp. Ricciae_BoGa-3]|uniref:flagellar brake protein n=1 Tax=Aneurinibacillus sp. Ricciae_BoGa-3 TaxID=3022697 RepID=UPI002341BF41|nr:PilZ domain-containing protein [Aneurinibacillus sp. Ricciae_BoGa-3]WCK56213.1 PilZ domain-containing protein [Aneurinibacillus sp. Ricciae_BoGa-3]